MEIQELIIRPLLLGLSTGLFCISFCVPLIGPSILGREKVGVKQSASFIGLFLFGRLVAYLLFGFVFGLLGNAFTRFWSIRNIFIPILYFVLGSLMILYGLIQSIPHIAFCRILTPKIQSRYYFLVLGFLAGINICPPFLLAITNAFDLGSALYGMLFFFIFFIATSIYLVPFLFSGFINRFKEIRIAARITSIFVGIYFIFLGLWNLNISG